MKFTSTVDELHHWLGMLTVDIQLGAAQRHLNATARLCEHLLGQLEQDPKMERGAFTILAFQLLDLQRAIAPKKPGPKERDIQGPKLRLVGP